MANETTRLQLPYPEGGDRPPDVAQALQRLSQKLDELAMSRGQGLFVDRPPAGTAGRMYWATDQAQMYFDDGTTWIAMGPAVELPIGGVLDWPATTSPPGPATWLELNGGPITRGEYPELFAAWNLQGQNANLPDRRGRSPMGAGSGPNLSPRAVGSAPGFESVTLTVNELPAHGHTGSTSVAGSHTHGVHNAGIHNHFYWDLHVTGIHGFSSAAEANNLYKKFQNYTDAQRLTTADGNHAHELTYNGDHGHSVTVGNTGNGRKFDIVHPSLVTRYFVRAR